MSNQLCSDAFLSASSSANAATSNDPPATHQLLMIFNGFGKHMNIMKMKTPCSAINMSKNANGDIVVVSIVEAASFIWETVNSISMQIAITMKRNATLCALLLWKAKNKER